MSAMQYHDVTRSSIDVAVDRYHNNVKYKYVSHTLSIVDHERKNLAQQIF